MPTTILIAYSYSEKLKITAKACIRTRPRFLFLLHDSSFSCPQPSSLVTWKAGIATAWELTRVARLKGKWNSCINLVPRPPTWSGNETNSLIVNCWVRCSRDIPICLCLQINIYMYTYLIMVLISRGLLTCALSLTTINSTNRNPLLVWRRS